MAEARGYLALGLQAATLSAVVLALVLVWGVREKLGKPMKAEPITTWFEHEVLNAAGEKVLVRVGATASEGVEVLIQRDREATERAKASGGR